jgi:hypothetical protein
MDLLISLLNTYRGPVLNQMVRSMRQGRVFDIAMGLSPDTKAVWLEQPGVVPEIMDSTALLSWFPCKLGEKENDFSLPVYPLGV